MKISLLIVDNQSKTDDQVKNMIRWIHEGLPGASVQVDEAERFHPEVLQHRPNVVILDVALNPDEERYLDGVQYGDVKFDPERLLTGIAYCRDLKGSFSDLPVILASQFFNADILSAAFKAGANGFLHKPVLEEESLIATLKAAYYAAKTDDIAFYEKLKDLLEDRSKNAWKRDHMLLAMDAFFTRRAGSRRLAGLWCSLAELVDDVVGADAINGLLRALMDAEALLLAANPRMRDHVRHAGNVFWLGYYILNAIPALKDPAQLPGHHKAAYEAGQEPFFHQVNVAWLLASLLHDVGYLGEKIDSVRARVQRGCSLLGIDEGPAKPSTKKATPPALDALKPYLQRLGETGKLLLTALSATSTRRGDPVNGGVVKDHGVLSASALLRCVERAVKKQPDRPEILHAAAAIALHNLPKWNKDWPTEAGPVSLPIGLLPAAWLLAYCDELQGWGREPQADPFDADSLTRLAGARTEFKKAFIKGSRIASFDVSETDVVTLKAKIEIGIQYMMDHGDDPEDASMTLREDVTRWKGERAESLRTTLGLDGLLETKIIHWIPAPVADPIEIPLGRT